jgi:putative transposase
MARQPRFVLPGHPQHVIQRGNNRNVIFADSGDYRFYLEKLQEACERFRCDIHAYVLMTNHAHLLMTPATGEGIGKVMQSLGRRYVQYFNYRYRRTGTLWEGRYKAALLDTEAWLLTCYRYIELNPVRAGMVNHPADYGWSSYRCNAMGRLDPLVTTHSLYTRLGATPQQRQQAYCTLFQHHINEQTLESIRQATNRAWVLGNDRFKEEISKLLERQAAPKARGGDRKSAGYRKQHEINRV